MNLASKTLRAVARSAAPASSRMSAAGAAASAGLGAIASLIPEIQTREMESVMRIQSGQTAILGGLIQDSVSNTEDSIPGVNKVPLVGQVLAQRRDLNQKTELVIFLRATVIRDPSLDGDFASFRNQLPREDFFSKPNPTMVAPPVGPVR